MLSNDFSISVEPMEVSVNQGNIGHTEVKVEFGSLYDKYVILRADSVQPGMNIQFEPDLIKKGDKSVSEVTIVVDKDAPAGEHWISIVGIGSDGKEHDCKLKLTVIPVIPKTGNIQVSSVPTGASVYLDGMYKGKTNTTLNDIQQGQHTVTLKLEGYEDWTQSVNVDAGKTTLITPTLSPIKIEGSISVSSSPTGASVYLDGKYQGETPMVLNNTEQGSHKITLTLEGYEEWSQSVNVDVGETTSVRATLATATLAPNTACESLPTGSISVSSSPTGASIYLDGKYQFKTPTTLNEVEHGSHTITLKLEGYEEWSQSVNVDVGKTTSVRATLLELRPIEVKILYPSNKTLVQMNEIVKGTALNIPEVQKLWIVVYDYDHYFPIGEAQIQKGVWQCQIHLNDKQHTGHGYEIYAVLADSTAQSVFIDQYTNGFSKPLEKLPDGAKVYDSTIVSIEPAEAPIEVPNATQTSIESSTNLSEQIKDYLKEFEKKAQIIFKPSEKMKVGEAKIIKAVISTNTSKTVPSEIEMEEFPESIVKNQNISGLPEENIILTSKNITVTELMKVTLECKEDGVLSIEAFPHDSNGIKPIVGERTTWEWKVTPQKPGKHNVSLNICYIINLGSGREIPYQNYSVKEIEENINVDVTLKYIWESYLQNILATLAAIASIYLVAKEIPTKMKQKKLIKDAEREKLVKDAEREKLVKDAEQEKVDFPDLLNRRK